MLDEDISTAKEFWKKASPVGKIFLAISLFFTISSIASLSDQVFKFRGFISEGLDFYRLVSIFLFGFLDELLVAQFTQENRDYIVILGMIIGAAARMNYVLLKESRRTFTIQIFRIFAFMFLLINTALLYGTLFNDQLNTSLSYNEAAFLFIFSLLFGLLGLKLHDEEDSEEGASSAIRSASVAFVSLYFISILAVLILAAINSGLTRAS